MTLRSLIKRNCKLFFKDKGMFITSLITPLILLVLYATFLAKVYKDAFMSTMPAGFTIDEKIIDSTVACQLLSSLLAVCCVTVAFCSNLLMVQDKVTGAHRDFLISPVKQRTLALGYFVSSAAVTLIICFTALIIGFIYIAILGWYLSVADVLLIICDVILLVLFGTALSSLINCRLKTNGQASAVGTIISSGYGFICGAYMPISNFSLTLQRVISFLPGTYGTALLRNHTLRGVFSEMELQGVPNEVIEGIKASVDCNIKFFDSKVSVPVMYLILIGTILLCTLGFVAISKFKKAK